MSFRTRDGAVRRRLLKEGSISPPELPVSREPVHHSKRMMQRFLPLRYQPRLLQVLKILLLSIGVTSVYWVSDAFLELKQTRSSYHPLVLGYYFSNERNVVTRIKRLAVYDYYRYPSKRQVDFPEEEFHRRIRNSKRYDRVRSEIVDDANCVLEDWQTTYYPTCNTIHENEISNFLRDDYTINYSALKSREQSQMIDYGYWRDGKILTYLQS